MTDNTNSNSNVSDLGHKAAQAWDRSSSNGDAGDALAICALYHAARTMTFSASVERKGSDIAETIDFDMSTWDTPRFNADGSRDNKAMTACTMAVADKVFGLTELNNAIKQRITRAKSAALYLYHNVADGDDVTMKGNKLVVPYRLVHRAPGADADDNKVTLYEAMKDKACTLDGKNGASLAELGRRARPETDKRKPAATGDKPDAGKVFSESLSHVLAIMLQATSEEGNGCDVAFDTALRTRLADLNVTLSRYFTDDPIEDEQRKVA